MGNKEVRQAIKWDLCQLISNNLILVFIIFIFWRINYKNILYKILPINSFNILAAVVV